MDIPVAGSATVSIDDCSTLAYALTRWFGTFFTVTGQPVTDLIDQVILSGARAEVSINEKSAVEAAIGLTAAGGRACVIMKHCGLAYALDSLANAAVHGTGGPLLIVSGDDCDAAHSTRIFDSRELAEAAGLPVLDLALDGDVGGMIAAAVEESASVGIPVIVRVTDRLHSFCRGGFPATEPLLFPLDEPTIPWRGVDTAVAHGLTKLGRHQRHRQVSVPQLLVLHAVPPMLDRSCGEGCDTGVVVSGAAVHLLPPGDYCRLTVRAAWPLPADVAKFARQHRRTLVAEEPGPYLETRLRQAEAGQAGLVLGRLTGHLPPEGSLSAEQVKAALDGAGPREWPEIAHKSPVAAAAPPAYAQLFEAITQLQRAGAFVATDVGSSVRLCYPPYQAATVALSLGSAIGVAGGAARAGRDAIAVTGDYALTHSGLEALIDCGRLRLPVLVLVLDNGLQAQTGSQPLPHADRAALVRACGIATVLDMETGDAATTLERLSAILHDPERRPAVVFARTGG